MLGSTCLNTISCFALVVANFSHLSPILKRITYLSPNKTLLCFFTPSPTPSALTFRTPWASSCSSSARKSLGARPVHHEDVGEERARLGNLYVRKQGEESNTQETHSERALPKVRPIRRKRGDQTGARRRGLLSSYIKKVTTQRCSAPGTPGDFQTNYWMVKPPNKLNLSDRAMQPWDL